MAKIYNLFCTNQRRKISHANFNHYVKGSLHPDRVMDEHDIFYVIEGSWEVGQNGTGYLLEAGDVILLHAGQHHYGIANCAPGTRTMFIHFECLPEDRLYPENIVQPHDDYTLAIPVVARCAGNNAVFSLFKELISSFWDETPNKVKLAALIDMLLFELTTDAKRNEKVKDPLVNEILNHIKLSNKRMLSLSDLSRLLNISARSITGRFKKATGKTVHSYQMDLKLEMALLLLKEDPSRTLREVAANFGFYDEFHFSRLFKKKYGSVPSEVKKKTE